MSEFMDEPIIPDSIEPYIGYKALRVMPDGRLASPQQNQVWPERQRLEAQCIATLSHWTWVPVEGEPRETEAVTAVDPAMMTFATAVTFTVSTSAAVSGFGMPSLRMPPKPTNPLPEGWNWSWEPLTHDSPAEECHCGIYVVATPEQTMNYMGTECVLVSVALWGTVIRGTGGARGQYAYPQSLEVPKSDLKRYRETSLLYGIPVHASWEEPRPAPLQIPVTLTPLAPLTAEMSLSSDTTSRSAFNWLRRRVL